jgi:hypothetical protein
VAAAPEVFDLIDDDVIDILLPEPPPEMESAVAEAVIACPKQAHCGCSRTNPGANLSAIGHTSIAALALIVLL